MQTPSPPFPSPHLPPVHRPRIKPALALLPKYIKTLNCGAWAGLAFISVAAVPPPTSKGALRSQARAGLAPYPEFVSHSQKESPTVISFWIPSPFSLLSKPLTSLRPPSASTLSIHCVFFSPSLLSLFFILSSTNSPPLPAGIILNFAFDDGATIKLPDPSTSQGGLSRIDAQPRRPAAHDIVLGYGNIISSRLSRRCQSRQ